MLSNLRRKSSKSYGGHASVGNLNGVEKVYHMLTPKPKTLLAKDRELVKHGELIYFSPNTMSKKLRYFFLFNDCLLITKRTGTSKFLLRLWMYLRPGVKIYSMPDSPNYEFRILVPVKGSVKTTKQRRLIMYGKDKPQKEAWVNALAHWLWVCSGKQGPDPAASGAVGEEGRVIKEKAPELDEEDKDSDDEGAQPKKPAQSKPKTQVQAKPTAPDEDSGDQSYDSDSDAEEPAVESNTGHPSLLLFDPFANANSAAANNTTTQTTTTTTYTTNPATTNATMNSNNNANLHNANLANNPNLYYNPQNYPLGQNAAFGMNPYGQMNMGYTTSPPTSGGTSTTSVTSPTTVTSPSSATSTDVFGMQPFDPKSASTASVTSPTQPALANAGTATANPALYGQMGGMYPGYGYPFQQQPGMQFPLQPGANAGFMGYNPYGVPGMGAYQFPFGANPYGATPGLMGQQPTGVATVSSPPTSLGSGGFSSSTTAGVGASGVGASGVSATGAGGLYGTGAANSSASGSGSLGATGTGTSASTTAVTDANSSTINLDAVAQDELLQATRTIEEITKHLQSRTRRAPERPPNSDNTLSPDLTQEDVSEAILDATTAISRAAAILLKAAAIAQKERVTTEFASSVGVGKAYHSDPVWAQGLISAARYVVAATQNLVTTAEANVQGQSKEEALVAASQAVTAATAQLVAAQRAKGNINSQSHLGLEDAAKGITRATAQLVISAQAASQQKNAASPKTDTSRMSMTEKEVMKFEKRTRVLELEKEKEKLRLELEELNKKDYTK